MPSCLRICQRRPEALIIHDNRAAPHDDQYLSAAQDLKPAQTLVTLNDITAARGKAVGEYLRHALGRDIDSAGRGQLHLAGFVCKPRDDREQDHSCDNGCCDFPG